MTSINAKAAPLAAPQSPVDAAKDPVDNAVACIEEALSGAKLVDNLERYIACREEEMADVLDGKSHHTFAFLQRAYEIQSGTCVPLLAA